jgi:uncharacterized protein
MEEFPLAEDKAEVLILMGKAPRTGAVKTRLSPSLPPRAAASLYMCLLEDAAEEMARLRGVDRCLAFSPAGEGRRFRASAFAAFRPVPQRGKDLGERMTHAMEAAFSRGARRVVLVGSDCPALSSGRVRDAFRELRDGAAAVFGPAADGGFYLVGLARPAPTLFRDVPWSTQAVLARVIGACREAGLPYALLPVESDVDTPEDVQALRRWVRSRKQPRCPRTRRWLTASRDG